MNRFAAAIILIGIVSTAAYAEGNRSSKILTPELASQILGSSAKASEPMNDTEIGKVWVSRISYSTDGGVAKRCGVLIRHAGSKDEASDTFHKSKDLYKGVSVPGFGDEAYRVTTPPQFNILKGQNWVIVSAGTTKVGDSAAQEAVAKAILPKIDAN